MNIFEEIKKESEICRQELIKENQEKSLDDDEPAGFRGSSFVYGDVPPKMKTSEYLSAAVGWVYGCVSLIADSIASTEFELYRVVKNGEIEPVFNHKILDLLYKANKFTTKFDHFWQTQEYLELTGEAPWFVDRGKSGKGEPQNLLLLRPDLLEIKKSEGNQFENPIEKYIYKKGFSSTIDISPEELIFIKYPDPINSFRGKGTLQAAAETVDIDNFSEDFNKRFFYNSARPDSLLTTEQKLTPRQRDTLRADLKRLYSGRENAHKTAILESGLDWKPMTISQRDMDFLNQQKFSMAKILSIFRVPKPLVAISDDVNLANALVAERIFAKWTITPKLQRIIAQLNEFLLPMFGEENLFLSFSDPVPSNIDTDIKRYDSGMGKGYLTINEIRKELNLEDIGEAGDKIYIPSAMVPIEMAGFISPTGLGINAKVSKKNIDKKGAIARSGGGYKMALRRLELKNKSENTKKESEDKIDNAVNKLSGILSGMIKKIVVAKNKEAVKKEEIKRDEKITKHTENYLKKADKFELDFKKIIVDQFEREKNVVLDKFTEKAISVDDYLLDEDDETQILVSASTPALKEIIKEQGDLAMLLVGADGNFDTATQRIQKWLKERAYKFSFEMTEETNRLLGDSLAEGVKLGEGIPKLRKRVEELFDNMEKYRGERIARSEVIRASNFGAKEAYIQSDVVEKMEWLATNDDRTCEFCAPLDGKKIGLSDTFFDKGDTYRGSDGNEILLDYDDIEHPPLHANCRCTIIPVIK